LSYLVLQETAMTRFRWVVAIPHRGSQGSIPRPVHLVFVAGKSVVRTGISTSTSVFSSIIPPMIRIYSLIFDRHEITGVPQRGSRKLGFK